MANRVTKERLAKASLAKTNNLNFTIEGIYEDDRQKFQAMSQDLGITFDGNNNVLDNTIKDNVTTLNGYFSGSFTGTFTIVDSVDFVGQTTTTKTVTVSNGLITSIV